jgi:GAF domain-containing protein
MSIFSRIIPSYTPSRFTIQGSLAVIRERLLQTFLIGTSVVAAIALSLSIINKGQNGQFYWLAGSGLAFVWLAIITLFRDLPYRFRAGSLALLAYALAIYELYTTSLLGEICFWLLIFNIITALLIGFRPVVLTTLISGLTVVGIGMGIQIGWLAIPYPENFNLGAGWIIAALTLTLISIGLGVGVNAMIAGLLLILDEREILVNQLKEERESLENHVDLRASDIQRTLTQVKTAAEISSTISQISDPDSLFQQVVDLIQTRMGLYYVGLFRVDEFRQYAVLGAGTGEAGQTMLLHNHRLQIGAASMIGWCIANRQPRIALDVGEEAVRFNNPLLPRTRSELALPILSHGEAVGALTVQSEQPEAFDQNDIIVLQGIADGLAAAIENTRLVAELKQNLDELRSLNRNYLTQAWTEVIEEKGAGTFYYENPGPGSTGKIPVEIPIVLREQTIAHLTLEIDETRLSADEMSFLDAIATQTALALENARLVQETERRVVQELKLNEMSARFSRSNDIETILKAVVEELGQLPSVSEVSVELVATENIHPSPGNEMSDNNGNGHNPN